MARSAGTAVTNSFIKGLITEATGLNFPENAVTETYNCVFERIGNVTRRLGIILEEGFTGNGVSDLTDCAISEFLWKGAALNGELVFLVIQVGDTISFYRLSDNGSLSSNLQSFSIDLGTYRVLGAPASKSITCSFAAGNGALFITHPYCEPFYVTYDQTTNSISSAAISLKIRDMNGLDVNAIQPGLTSRYNERPAIASVGAGAGGPAYLYNLLNQGWVAAGMFVPGAESDNYNASFLAPGAGISLPISYYARQHSNSTSLPFIDWWLGVPSFTGINGVTPYTKQTTYPCNAEVYWLYFYPGTKYFDVQAINTITLPNAPIAKGHFIFNPFNTSRAALSMEEYHANGGTIISLTTLPEETSGYYRPSQVAFFSGRAVYAGVSAAKYNTRLYFTKVIENTGDYGLCHQILDPTAEEGGDLVASDGGVIVIPEMAQVIKLFSTGANLFVFATNGIWRISGSLGNTGFAANAYAVTRISTINAQSGLSFVDVEGMPYFWNNDGIWFLKSDQLGTSVQVDSLSLTSIATFIEGISEDNKRFVKGAYNPFSKRIQWIYRSNAAETVEEHYQYDRILNYDTLTKAFYPWSLTDDALTRICGIFVPQGTVGTTVPVDVLASTANVIADTDQVVIEIPDETALESTFKYITLSEADDTPPVVSAWLASNDTYYSAATGVSRSATGQSVFFSNTNAGNTIYKSSDASAGVSIFTGALLLLLGRPVFSPLSSPATTVAHLHCSLGSGQSYLSTYSTAGAGTVTTSIAAYLMTENNVGGSNLTWWTDNKLYFSAPRAAADRLTIFSINPNASGLATVLDGGVGVSYDQPAIGNDGSDFMVVQKTVAGPTTTWWRCTLAGTGLTQITFDFSPTITLVSNINIFPDGAKMAFQASCNDGSQHIIISDISGNNCQSIAQTSDLTFWTSIGAGLAVATSSSGFLSTVYFGVINGLSPFERRVFQSTFQAPFNVSFAQENNTSFLDWTQEDPGFDYDSYFISGYKLRGEGIRKFQTNWLKIFFKHSSTDDPGSSTFDFSGRWDYTVADTLGRFTQVQRIGQAQTVENQTYEGRRLKVRGRGDVLQIKILSVSGMPFDITGWTCFDTVAEKP